MNTENTSHHDDDLPDASAVMASLCCVAVRYAASPSLELATLAAELSRKLTAPRYAESRLVREVAQRLVTQWQAIVETRSVTFASVIPASAALH